MIVLPVAPRGAGVIAALTAVETPKASATPKKSTFIVILASPAFRLPIILLPTTAPARLSTPFRWNQESDEEFT